MRQKLDLRLLGMAWMLVGCTTATIAQADWNRFRGPNGTGVAEGSQATPVEWSPSKNLKWKIPLPGSGVSCPIVVGDKVFVTCYSGYGVRTEAGIGSMDKLTRHLLCISKASGEVLWQKDIASTTREDDYVGPGVTQHGYASHTPTSDGQNVYAFFGKGGVYAYDLAGNELWHTEVGKDSDPRSWGSSSSPIVHEGVLVVPAGPESRAIIGLDKYTGKELWRSPADGFGMVWGTPAIATTENSSQIVIGAPYEIWALNPENGKLTWFCEAVEADQFSSSVVVQDDKIYAIEGGGRGGGSIALRAGGKDDITKTNVLWTGRDSSRFGTPVVYQDRLYFVNSSVVNCLDATTGKEIFQARLRNSGARAEPAANAEAGRGGGGGGGFGGGGGRGGGGGGMGGGDYSSPVIADGKLYYVTRGGDMYVVAADKEFKQLACNRVTADAEDFSATPAISDGAIFVRSDKHLYCVSE